MTTIFPVCCLNKRYIFRVGKRGPRIATKCDKSASAYYYVNFATSVGTLVDCKKR